MHVRTVERHGKDPESHNLSTKRQRIADWQNESRSGAVFCCHVIDLAGLKEATGLTARMVLLHRRG